MLPDFFIIGAMKAGTTSLWRYLRDHPQIFMATPKELHFFSGERPPSREWYESRFEGAKNAAAVGEASTSYSKWPAFPDAPTRIAEIVPNARFIYLLREPIERMRSQYVHNVLADTEDRAIELALTGAPTHFNSHYIAFSQYATQLERYLTHFALEHFLLVTTEDLRDHTVDTLGRIFTFLEVDPSWRPPMLQKRHHETAARRPLRPLIRRLRRIPTIRRVVRKVPVAWQERVSRTATPISVEISSELRTTLEAAIADDIRRLRHYMGEGFDGWGIA